MRVGEQVGVREKATSWCYFTRGKGSSSSSSRQASKQAADTAAAPAAAGASVSSQTRARRAVEINTE